MKRSLALSAGIALAIPLALTGTAATAAPAPPPPQVRAENLVSPLKLAVDVGGSIYVTQNFAGQLTKIARDGTQTPLYTSENGAEVGGVSAFLGTVYFTETVIDPNIGPVESYLKKIDRHGNVSDLADIRAYENQANPDAKAQYGFTDLPADCLAQVPAQIPGSYAGIQDSHPYATLGTPIGTVVADAGSNALFTVDRAGKVRTLAVLPPQPYVVDEAALALGLPECAIGYTYNFEPVPTDVELGPDGWLYVSLLPGGPEGPELGARGAVVKVNLLNGKVVPVASGLVTATDLAVSPRGDIYVAQLFGPHIGVIKKGTSEAVPFREATQGAAVEWGTKGIYATVNALSDPPAGQVVLLPF
ncbi:ScyD/ScyE family protein [Microbacterium sp. DT81.1]|uniref:ScyD/ScyE family protein n=1 Tax=Microbacterium sp. DT81.1 TaxID=3393413 RepID=UPI003CF87B76